MHAAIIGLGLMGGSLALALRRCGWASRLTAVTRRTETLAAARASGAIDEGATDLITARLDEADVIVLATPVRTLLRQLPEVGRLARPGAVILDLGSTKEAVCAAMEHLPEGLQPLGGHPMCGKETGGFASAEADLFTGTTFVLCPLPRTSGAALATAASLAEAVGSRVQLLDPAEHDRAVAAISHLPYLAAAGLVNAVTAAGDPLASSLAASGFRDTTRVAASDPDMMLDILLTNREAVLGWLAAYTDQLGALEAMLRNGDEAALRTRLSQAQETRRAMRF
jgi:prephenate dehydrogenase